MTSVFSKNHAGTTAMAKGEDVINEINALLSEMKDAKETGQLGGKRENELVNQINTLLSDIKGTNISLSKDEVEELAMNGGKRKMKSKGKKSRSRSSSRSKAKKASKSSKSSKPTKTKSKSRSRSMKREEGEPQGEKKKRAMNPYMEKLIGLKRFIVTKIDKGEVNNVGAFSSAASDLLKENDVDLEKAKKNFEIDPFMKVYNVKKVAIEKKRAEKKAMKV